MVIAAAPEHDGDWRGATSESGWPRSALRPTLLTDVRMLARPDLSPGFSAFSGGGDSRENDMMEIAANRERVSAGACNGRRLGRRARARRRDRGILLGVVAVGLVTALSLPLDVLGGSSAVPVGVGRVASQTIYVVQPGDTLWSIALRFDRQGDPRALAVALARETGSAVVVPGERIPIP
jgi:hypothetical protein